jgi:hypothetical protein
LELLGQWSLLGEMKRELCLEDFEEMVDATSSTNPPKY